MGKLISKRYFLDYNSTSPLAKSVKRWLSKGDFDFMNPSSTHALGKKAKAQLNESRDYIYKIFGLNNEYALFFHSGATEGNNTVIRGWANAQTSPGVFYYSELDHSSICTILNYLEGLGHTVCQIPIDKNGDLVFDKLVQSISDYGDSPIFINYTVVNNETGVYWSLEEAEKIKKISGAYIHIDASQLVGKVENWNDLSNDLDSYTFSGHKFGALKGSGFSFYQKNTPLIPLLQGGGQQDGMRSGTLNVAAVNSICLALKEQISMNPNSIARDYLENEISALLDGKGEILFSDSKKRSLNTLFFVVYDLRAEVVLASFDLEGLMVSAGSACSAEIIEPSRAVNMSLGASSRLAAPVRISLSPQFSLKNAKKVHLRLKKIFNKLLK